MFNGCQRLGGLKMVGMGLNREGKPLKDRIKKAKVCKLCQGCKKDCKQEAEVHYCPKREEDSRI